MSAAAAMAAVRARTARERQAIATAATIRMIRMTFAGASRAQKIFEITKAIAATHPYMRNPGACQPAPGRHASMRIIPDHSTRLPAW